jgi:hypothetical protein
MEEVEAGVAEEDEPLIDKPCAAPACIIVFISLEEAVYVRTNSKHERPHEQDAIERGIARRCSSPIPAAC